MTNQGTKLARMLAIAVTGGLIMQSPPLAAQSFPDPAPRPSVTPSVAQSDIPKSQLASITQHIAGTTIDVVYRRPVARGRTLFGALVPWGRVWSPSADSAPRFTTSTPIEVNGAPLAAGSYSLWAIPGEKEWTWIFSSQVAAFHMRYPGEGRDVLRVKSAPETAGQIETLTLSFPLVDADSAIFRLHWGTTAVPIRIRAKR